MEIITKRINTYNFEFRLTCGACPEQYDVYFDDEQVAYVRLRWGALRCDYPCCGGEVIFTADLNDYPMQGEFASYEQRDFYLEKIAQSIYNKIFQSETVR